MGVLGVQNPTSVSTRSELGRAPGHNSACEMYDRSENNRLRERGYDHRPEWRSKNLSGLSVRVESVGETAPLWGFRVTCDVCETAKSRGRFSYNQRFVIETRSSGPTRNKKNNGNNSTRIVRGNLSTRVPFDDFSGTKIGFCSLLFFLAKVCDPVRRLSAPRTGGTWSFWSTKSLHHPNAETYVIHRAPERERRGRAYRGTLRAATVFTAYRVCSLELVTQRYGR